MSNEPEVNSIFQSTLKDQSIFDQFQDALCEVVGGNENDNGDVFGSSEILNTDQELKGNIRVEKCNGDCTKHEFKNKDYNAGDTSDEVDEQDLKTVEDDNKSQTTPNYSDISEEKSEKEDSSTVSLLAILDDKNNVIANLKEQLHNQKMQLKHYMQDKISEDTVKKFSRTCLHETIDDNMAVNLEVANYCKKTGISSKIRTIYEHIQRSDIKLRCLMKLHEKVLKLVTNKVLQGNGDPSAFNVEALKNQPGQYSLLYNMYQIDGQIHKELRNLRICSNKLTAIEEERNSLAEELCALPPKQKNTCRTIIMLQDEKLSLEQEIKELKAEKRHLLENNPISDLGADNTSLESLNKMLEAVNKEATILLKTSIIQKESFLNDIQKLECQNQDLKNRLKKLSQALKNKQDVELKFQNLEDMCVQAMKENMAQQKVQQQRWKKDVKILKKRLNMTEAQNPYLKKQLSAPTTLDNVSEADDAVKEIEAVKKERDEYKLKFERLVAIKEMHNDLVEQNLLLKEIETAKTNKICDLKESYDSLILKFNKQVDISSFLNKHIKSLLFVIYLLRKNEKELSRKESLKADILSAETLGKEGSRVIEAKMAKSDADIDETELEKNKNSLQSLADDLVRDGISKELECSFKKSKHERVSDSKLDQTSRGNLQKKSSNLQGSIVPCLKNSLHQYVDVTIDAPMEGSMKHDSKNNCFVKAVDDCGALVDKITKASVWSNKNLFPKKSVTYAPSVTAGVKIISRDESLEDIDTPKNKYKTVKSSPALEKLQRLISQFSGITRSAHVVKSEPRRFNNSSMTILSSDYHPSDELVETRREKYEKRSSSPERLKETASQKVKEHLSILDTKSGKNVANTTDKRFKEYKIPSDSNRFTDEDDLVNVSFVEQFRKKFSLLDMTKSMTKFECVGPAAFDNKNFTSETCTTLDSVKVKTFDNSESDLMKDCSDESLLELYKNLNKKLASTQYSRPSILKNNNRSTTVATLTKSIDTQTSRILLEKACSNFLKNINASTSKLDIPKEEMIDVGNSTSLSQQVGTEVSLESNSTGTELEYISCEKESYLGSFVEKSTPLENLLENVTIPSELLKISDSELYGKLDNLSTRLDTTLNEENNGEKTLIGTIRSIFDNLFSGSSYYAKDE